MAQNFTPKICPVCGKEFIPAPLTIYKVKIHRRVKLLCSYACYLQAKCQKSRNKLTETPNMYYNDNGGDSHEQ